MIVPRSVGSRIYVAQLIAVVVGLAVVIAGPWRVGVIVIGATFVVGAVSRIVVPADHTGMLRVRGRIFDVLWMATLGVAVVVLAVVVPSQPH